ncbi:MAG: nucleotidyl transferase AbiEii/AbiGii toxin family protein [Phycisphaerales bacterium]
MDNVAKLPAKDREDLFTAVAAERGITAGVIEKDFWVCWVLKRLFTLEKPPAGLLFKGGTSLSKVYNAIQRFSEDVDLSFDRAALGFSGQTDPANLTSRKKREAALDELSAACRDLVRGEFLTLLRAEFDKALGGKEPWALDAADDAEDGQTLLFSYPRLTRTGSGTRYVQDVVRLEFGARGDHWPAVTMPVVPYAAETMPRLFSAPRCSVTVLSGERTFWEKATILHMWHHIKDDRAFPRRQSRHYYDLVSLYGHEIGKRAMADLSLLEAVAKHKSVFFHSGWANYENAKPGTLRLLPRAERLRELERDYDEMRGEMLFGTPPAFEQLLAVLREMEAAVNGRD